MPLINFFVYLEQLEHPSNIIIGQKVSRLGTKSFDIQSAIYIVGKENPICSSLVTSVCYDFIMNKSIPIYNEIKNDYLKK